MFSSITVLAPAKINIGLRVFPKRSDGYHNIASIFTTVGLADELKITLTDKKNTCDVFCSGMDSPLPTENTITAAYKAFCVLTGINYGFEVELSKHIPSGGGLGGGSSDASSFIQSIDNLCSTHLKAGDLHSLAGSVGSDVYFFTHALLEKVVKQGSEKEDVFSNSSSDTGGRYAALVTGRGEIIKTLDARNDFGILLVFPGVSVSTKNAYALVDSDMKHKQIAYSFQDEENIKYRLVNEYIKPVREWDFLNDFTTPVSRQFPAVKEALEDLKKSGADFVDMSGSGSTVFGVFETVDAAAKAQQTLEKRWQTVLA